MSRRSPGEMDFGGGGDSGEAPPTISGNEAWRATGRRAQKLSHRFPGEMHSRSRPIHVDTPSKISGNETQRATGNVNAQNYTWEPLGCAI